MSAVPLDLLPSVHEEAEAGARHARVWYLLRRALARLAQGAFVVWAAGTLIFIAVQIAPGEVIDTLLGANSNDISLRQQITQEWGLDHPPTVQYLLYFARLLRGDLGTSYVEHRTVNSLLADQLSPTVELTLWGFGIAVVLAVILATFTSGRSRIGKGISQAFELTLVSVPPFWLGMLLLSIFSFRLGWFPVAGTAGVRAVILPALAIGLPIGCFLAQVLREGLDRALEQPFALTARARGASLIGVKWVHALRHASLPALTIGGLTFGNLLGGAVICEQVFGRPGLGQLAVHAINTTDIPVILAVGMLSAVVFVVITTVIDLVYLAVDPRLRSEAQWSEAGK
ncbi:MAG: ABC transporter permease [Propionibacteriaceae bacterium]|jgi:peptide/nickel transport system permease protein|nr:ABC transporter permease [Propionibacteriaceae bacterium]